MYVIICRSFPPIPHSQAASPAADDFDLYSLGFLIIWLDSEGDVVNSQGTTENKDVVNIAGTDVWWPW